MERPKGVVGRWYDYVTLNVYWFGVSFMWNALHPIVLPMLLLDLTAEHVKNSAYSLLTFAGLLVALVVQPISGALSDRTHHRLGRRRPWMILGCLLALVFLGWLAWAPTFYLLAAGYILLQFASNLGHGAGQGLIPDLVDVHRHGIAAGAKNLFDIVGIVAAALIAGGLMGAAAPRPGTTLGIIAALLVATLLVTVLGTREHPTSAQRGWRMPRLGIGEVRELLRVDVRANRDYTRLLVARFLVFYGTYSVQSFALFYFRDALAVADPAGAVGRVMAVIGITIIIATLPAGALSERWGRKLLSLVACALVSAGLAMLVFAPSMLALGGIATVIGLGMGIFASVNWAWATDLVPPPEAGKYLGLSNLATAGSAATARLMGPIVDLVNARWLHAGYSLAFGLAAVAALLGLLVLLTVREPLLPYRAPRQGLTSSTRRRTIP